MQCSYMANVFARFLLFLSSYIPLWVIFAVITVKEHAYVASGFACLAVLSFLGMIFFLRQVQSLSGVKISIGTVRRQDSETMSYIASYVVPFAATSLDQFEQVVSLGIFLFVLCIIYVNTSMIHINPILSALGYRLFEIEEASGGAQFLISRRRIGRGETIDAISIAEGIVMEKRK